MAMAIHSLRPRRRQAQMLWPEKDSDAARNSLRQRLFQPRKKTGFKRVVGQATLTLASGVEPDLADADTVLGDIDVEIGGEFAARLEQQHSRRCD